MKLFSPRIASWLPVMFVIAGSFAMAAGIFSTSALAVVPADIELPSHAAVYVGAGTCYTCHTDDFDGWSVPLDLQALADESAEPKQVVADVAALEEVEHVDVDESADACASVQYAAQSAGSESRQYIVKTDMGESLLPLQWNDQDPAVMPDQHAADSVDCTVNYRSTDVFAVQPVVQVTLPRLTYVPLISAETATSRHEVTNFQILSETAFMEGQSA